MTDAGVSLRRPRQTGADIQEGIPLLFLLLLRLNDRAIAAYRWIAA